MLASALILGLVSGSLCALGLFSGGQLNWWDMTSESVNSAMVASFDNRYAYFGTYTVDYAAGIVTVNVVADVLRAYTGTVQPRPFKFVKGDLVIGDPTSYIRRFKRVASGTWHLGHRRDDFAVHSPIPIFMCSAVERRACVSRQDSML